VTFTYLTCRSRPSSKGKPTVFSLTAAQSAWRTFPFAYTTPKDACYVRITVALSSAGTLDVDDVR